MRGAVRQDLSVEVDKLGTGRVQMYPKLQILSAQDLIDGKQVRMPQGARSEMFAKAGREKQGVQGRLG